MARKTCPVCRESLSWHYDGRACAEPTRDDSMAQANTGGKMEGLSHDDIAALLAPPKARGKKWGVTYGGQIVPLKGIGDKDAREAETAVTVSERVGRFNGKLGTPVRSRKGRTYRKGDGYARYTRWNDGRQDILAYVNPPS